MYLWKGVNSCLIQLAWIEERVRKSVSPGLQKNCCSCSPISTAIWSYHKNLYPRRTEREKKKNYFNQFLDDFHFKSGICQTCFYTKKSIYILQITKSSLYICFAYGKAGAQAYIEMYPHRNSTFGGEPEKQWHLTHNSCSVQQFSSSDTLAFSFDQMLWWLPV